MFDSDLHGFARLAAVMVLAAGTSTCSREDGGAPVPPDVTRLVAAYDEPEGTLDPARPAPWLQTAQAQLEVLGGGKADMVIRRMVARSMDRIERVLDSLPSSHAGLLPSRVDGVLTLNVSCGDASHEKADVSVAIVDGAASPVLWGTAHACPLWQRGRETAAYDGSFTMYRYPDGDLLVGVDGTIDGIASRVRLDFRIVGARLEKRVTTPTGDVITAQDGVDVLARAANGVFRCDARRRMCR